MGIFLYTRVRTGGDYIMSKKIFIEKDRMKLSTYKFRKTNKKLVVERH